MKWTTLLFLSASGMAASGGLVWTAVQPDASASVAARSASPDPAADPGATPRRPRKPARPAALDTERAHFQAGSTLVMEGRLGHPVLPSTSDSQTYLFVEIGADGSQRAAVPAPLNLSIVMDRSGSMKGKRLANATAAARSAIQRLRDGDVVSLVAYNTAAEVLAPPTTIDSTSRARLLGSLGRLRAAGDTCISCGVDAGMRLLGQRAGMVGRVLLLSDGEATAGVRDVEGFRRVAEDCRRMGASITTIGVDVDYNERIMAALARDSNGRHFFVENPSGLASIFDREMETLASTVANNAELTVDFAPGVFAEHVYDRSSAASGSQVVVPLGAFAASDHKTVLVRLRVPRGSAGERPVAAVRLRFDDLTRGQPGASEGALVAQLTDDESKVAPLDGLVSARLSSSETAEALEQANALFRAGQSEAARKLVQDKAGVLNKRLDSARVTVASGRAGDLDDSFKRQTKALEQADTGFAQPPASAAPAADTPAAVADERERDRKGKAQIRNNQKDAFDLAE
ncbi:MAG TPA: VWA domain-containing protein [Kofleriaceae bacterium]|nr:VWA domain-containing protein [Kofleriaceae bacterium]